MSYGAAAALKKSGLRAPEERCERLEPVGRRNL